MNGIEFCEDCQKRKAVLTLQFPDGHPVKYCNECYIQLKKEYFQIPKPRYIKNE